MEPGDGPEEESPDFNFLVESVGFPLPQERKLFAEGSTATKEPGLIKRSFTREIRYPSFGLEN